MGDLTGLASAGLAMIVSILTVELTLASVFSFTASALKYFSSYQRRYPSDRLKHYIENPEV